MGILVPWPTDVKETEPKVPQVSSHAEYLFNLYREARIRQGWEEFLWKSLSETQQFVWRLIAAQIWKQEE